MLKVTTQILQLCHKTLERIITAKISEWQHKYYTIVSQDFGGNKYSKIAG